MSGWGALDVMNQALAGETPDAVPGQAHISFYADPEHNLPPEGAGIDVPFDYAAEYTQLWTNGKR